MQTGTPGAPRGPSRGHGPEYAAVLSASLLLSQAEDTHDVCCRSRSGVTVRQEPSQVVERFAEVPSNATRLSINFLILENTDFFHVIGFFIAFFNQCF